MRNRDEQRTPFGYEDDLRDLFDRTAASMPESAARRMEASARGIPGAADARRRSLVGWLAPAAALAAAAVLAVVLWPGELPRTSTSGAPAVALTSDVRSDAGTDAGTRISTLSDEQATGWEASLDPFGEDEAPSLVGSVSLAHGLGDQAELELWVQAADEILDEQNEI